MNACWMNPVRKTGHIHKTSKMQPNSCNRTEEIAKLWMVRWIWRCGNVVGEGELEKPCAECVCLSVWGWTEQEGVAGLWFFSGNSCKGKTAWRGYRASLRARQSVFLPLPSRRGWLHVFIGEYKDFSCDERADALGRLVNFGLDYGYVIRKTIKKWIISVFIFKALKCWSPMLN